MATRSPGSRSSISSSMSFERRDLVAAGLVLVVGIGAVVGLGMTQMETPGLLPQDTAFLVLGGAVLALVPATFALLYASKENRRRLEEHERLAWAQFETLEGQAAQAARNEELESRMDELVGTARETRQAQETQKAALARVERLVEDDRQAVARIDDKVNAVVENGHGEMDEVAEQLQEIAERQETMFSEVLSRQEQAFETQARTLRQTLQMEEERLTSLLDRQERLLGSEARADPEATPMDADRPSEGSEPYPSRGLHTARSLGRVEPMEATPEQRAGSKASKPPVRSRSPHRHLERQTELLGRLVEALESTPEPPAHEGAGLEREAPSRGAILEERPRFPVAAYRIEEIPTVGAGAARELGTYGVNLTDTLLHTDLERLADVTEIDRGRLESWRDTAELMSLEGMGPELSARLVEVGISSIVELSRLDPDELSDLLLATYEGEEAPGADVLERTLPRRSEKIVDRARAAAMRLEPHEASPS